MSNTTTIVDKELKPGGDVAPPEETEHSVLDTMDLSEKDIRMLGNLAAKISADPNFDVNSFKLEEPEVVKKTFISDFSNITEDMIYDMDNIEARPFMSADILKATLKDSNYIARWVNKNQRRLGSMIARGFEFVKPGDLLGDLNESIAKDAEGHFAYDDVVLMRMPKALYFAALKAAQLRAENATKQIQEGTIGKNHAMNIMQKEAGSEFATAFKQGKISFYTPPVGA